MTHLQCIGLANTFVVLVGGRDFLKRWGENGRACRQHVVGEEYIQKRKDAQSDSFSETCLVKILLFTKPLIVLSLFKISKMKMIEYLFKTAMGIQ